MKYVSSHRDRFGKLRYRFRKTGCRPRYLRAEYGTPEFAAEVQEALAVSDNEPLVVQGASIPRRWPSLRGVPVVYFIAARSGPIKIGTSTNVHKRLSQLQVSHAHQLRLIAVIHGGIAEEAAIHERFADIRLRGEWFKRTPELTFFVAGLDNLGPPVRQMSRKFRLKTSA